MNAIDISNKTIKDTLASEPLFANMFRTNLPETVEGQGPPFSFQRVKHDPNENKIHVWEGGDTAKETLDALIRAGIHRIYNYVRNGRKDIISKLPKVNAKAPLESKEYQTKILPRLVREYNKHTRVVNALKDMQSAVFNEPEKHPRIAERIRKSQEKLHNKTKLDKEWEPVPLLKKLIVRHMKDLQSKRRGKFTPNEQALKDLYETSRTPGTTKAFIKLYKTLLGTKL